LQIWTPSITAYELYTGAEKCAVPERERTKIDRLLFAARLAEFDLEAARESARIRWMLESQGQTIGPYDLLLAGQAIAFGLTFVTNNPREFSRISGLVLEDWRS
jgi:tRNA(fMet)-specific endonuclease VapC